MTTETAPTDGLPEARDYIAEAVAEWWGERCPEFDEGCFTCLAWKQYDDLKSFPRKSGQGHARP